LKRAATRFSQWNRSEFITLDSPSSYNTLRSSSSDSEALEADDNFGGSASASGTHSVSSSRSRPSKNNDSNQNLQSDNKPKPFRPRRTANQIARLFCCPHAECEKRYGSEGALKGHIRIKHPDVFPEYQRLRVEAPMQIIVSPTQVSVVPAKNSKKRKSRPQETSDAVPHVSPAASSVSGADQTLAQGTPASAFFASPEQRSPRSHSYHSIDEYSPHTASSSQTNSPRSPDDNSAVSPATSPISGPRSTVYFAEIKYETATTDSLQLPASKRRATESLLHHEMQHASQQSGWEEYQLTDPYNGFYPSYDVAHAHVSFSGPTQHQLFNADPTF
jgi:hypothetical protein